MFTDLLIFGLGASIGLATHRNEVVTNARMRAVELLVDLEVGVSTWPINEMPLRSAEGELEWRKFRERLLLWLVAAGVRDQDAWDLTTSADTLWRGKAIQQALVWRPGHRDEKQPPEAMLLRALTPLLSLWLTDRWWKRLQTARLLRATRRAID